MLSPGTEGQLVTNLGQGVLRWMDRHWKSSFLKYLVFSSPYVPLSLKQPQEIFFSASETFLHSCAEKNNVKKLFHPSLPNPSIFLTLYACQEVFMLIFSPMSSSRPLGLGFSFNLTHFIFLFYINCPRCIHSKL